MQPNNRIPTLRARRDAKVIRHELVVFGYCTSGRSNASTIRGRFSHLAELLGRGTGLEIAAFEASSYEELASATIAGAVDLAWLPPLVLASLVRGTGVTPLVRLYRHGRGTFKSVLVVRESSPIAQLAELRGMRAAWVDRNSASGFVIPRIQLERVGIDPRVAFSAQRFFHAHESVVRAVALDRADFGATYAGIDAAGHILHAPWLAENSDFPRVRVLACFGTIPGDVVAARAGLRLVARRKIASALIQISRRRASRLFARDAFGAEAFRLFSGRGYQGLRKLAEHASDRGLTQVGY